MNASQKTNAILNTFSRRNIKLTFEQVYALRRAEMTLHRWSEQECGNSNDWASWCITRDEQTGKPYRETHCHNENKCRRYPVRDLERGALKRVKSICDSAGLVFYHQLDPRGCALYVGTPEMLRGSSIDSNYSNLVAVCA